MHLREPACHGVKTPSLARARKRFSGRRRAGLIKISQAINNLRKDVRLLLKLGGADPTHGPVGGIHWHMSGANKIEYYASDEGRQKIPYVRMTDAQGVVTEFRAGKFTNTVSVVANGGGMNEWEARGQPQETGPQNRGQIRKGGIIAPPAWLLIRSGKRTG